MAACLQGGTGEKKPGEGYESHKARRVRLEHQAMAYVLHDWDECTADKKAGFLGGQNRKGHESVHWCCRGGSSSVGQVYGGLTYLNSFSNSFSTLAYSNTIIRNI